MYADEPRNRYTVRELHVKRPEQHTVPAAMKIQVEHGQAFLRQPEQRERALAWVRKGCVTGREFLE